MKKGRLEAFSDGVLAIIITIMVLEMKAPKGTDISYLLPITPIFLSYVLSFIYVAIYWINHHNLFQFSEKVSVPVLWANIHLLFWLSLIPFTTSWLGENHIEPVPVAFYGANLFMCAAAYKILETTLLKSHTNESVISQIIRRGLRENISIIIYLISIPLAFVHIVISIASYVIVAILWIIPFKKIKNYNVPAE